MTNNWLRWSMLAVVVAIAGFWLWQAFEDPVQEVAALALVLTAVVGAVWLSRLQAARRQRAALDAYAERALARERRWLRPKRLAARAGGRDFERPHVHRS
jgi:hypothetical protein